MLRGLLAVCAVAAAVGASGCKSLKTGATEAFAREYSCPEDRVDARERPDVSGSSLIVGPPPVATPPADVRSDPGRLAKWKADQAQAQSGANDFYDSMTVFEVNGCGHKAFYACNHPAKRPAGADPVGCIPGRHPPP